MIKRGILIKKSREFLRLVSKYPNRFIVETVDDKLRVIDTFIDKTKDELEVDVLVLRCENGTLKKLYILKEGITIASYLEYYKLGMKNVQKHSMIRNRLLDDEKLPSPLTYTFETFESVQDIFLNKDTHYKNLKNSIVKVVEPKRIIAKHSTKELPKMEFFQYDTSSKLELTSECDFLNKIFQLASETGALIVGSYPLSLLKKDRFKPDDIDIFSHSLKFIRELLRFIHNTDNYYFCKRLKLKRFYRLDSYKLCIPFSGNMDINFIHLGDNCEPEDLELSPEEDRQKTKKFICDRFDISACITCFDGKYFHYNKSIDDDLMECRYSTNVRIEKYLSRGYTSKETIHTTNSTYKPRFLYENDETD